VSNRKKVVIAGGTGFIGTALVEELLENGYEPHILTRSDHILDTRVSFSTWDGKTLGPWTQSIEDSRAVINLSGHPLLCRWTAENKEKIVNSRIESTTVLGKAIATTERPPLVWVNASGIDIYADSNAYSQYKPNGSGESTPKGTGFLAEFVSLWERSMYEIKTPHTCKVALRIGWVLGVGGGTFERFHKLTRWFLGGQLGNGKQYISWIHIKDLARLMVWVLENDISGPVNATAPKPVTNAEFMATLRKALKRPWSPPAPAFAVKLGAKLLGIDPQLMLGSHKILPIRATENGFKFLFPQLEEAIEDLVAKKSAQT
jgi:hypothetical protein